MLADTFEVSNGLSGCFETKITILKDTLGAGGRWERHSLVLWTCVYGAVIAAL